MKIQLALTLITLVLSTGAFAANEEKNIRQPASVEQKHEDHPMKQTDVEKIRELKKVVQKILITNKL